MASESRMKQVIKANGYSLIEMLFVVAIAAAAIGVSAPFLVKYRENSDFESAAEKIIFQVRRTKTLAVMKGKTHIICVPLGETNSENAWKFFTTKNTDKTCKENDRKIIMENTIPYRTFQRGGGTEIKKLSFRPRGTSTNKSFCIENKNGNRWKKITVSNFARITVTTHTGNPCN